MTRLQIAMVGFLLGVSTLGWGIFGTHTVKRRHGPFTPRTVTRAKMVSPSANTPRVLLRARPRK